MKKKIISGLIIIGMGISAILLHEMLFALNKLIPFPIVIGMIGGWGLTYLYYRK